MATAWRSSLAERDLMEIWGYNARDDPFAADRLLDEIDEACTMLASHPLAGPKREDLAPGHAVLSYRELSSVLYPAQ